jgi:hypothetical protein
MKKQLYVIKDLTGRPVCQTQMTESEAKKANKDLAATSSFGLRGIKKWEPATAWLSLCYH